MSKSIALHTFLENIMQVKVTSMGGAAAGIIGSSDTNNDTIHNLKKASVAFAKEYQKQESDQFEIVRLADRVGGYLQTLLVTNTLSEDTTDKLLGELEELVTKARS